MSNWSDALTALGSSTARELEQSTHTRIVRPATELSVVRATLRAAIDSRFTRIALMWAKLNGVAHSRSRLRRRGGNSNAESTYRGPHSRR